MTLPHERTRAVLTTRAFLRQLAAASEQSGVPSGVREHARLLLRHYPSQVHMDFVHNACPSWFGPASQSPEEAPPPALR